MARPRKLLSIGHSYVVALNRRLVNEMARLGEGEWEVTAIAPSFFHGDLRSLSLETDPQESCNLQSIPVHFSQKIHLMAYGWRLRQLLQQDWDLVHCWEEPYILSGGQIAWWKPRKTPLVYRTAQSYSKQYPPPFQWIEQYAMSRASGWICSGKMVAKTLQPRPGYSLPMRLIPLGVDVNYFYPNPDAGLQICRSLGWETQEAPVIGYLGRFVPEKGLDLLMQALEGLQTPWRALFVGTGVMESSLRTWAKRYPEQVRICTNVKHNDVPNYLNAMDLLVAPSQSLPHWREQFGRMLVEAMSCGVPVIGSDSGEIPYVIDDVGKVVGEKDVQGWIEAISELLENPQQRQDYAQKGLERVHHLYAWSIIARKHLDFFTELVEA